MPIPLPFYSFHIFQLFPPQVLPPPSFTVQHCVGFSWGSAEAQEQGHLPEVTHPVLGLAAAMGSNCWAVQ